MNFSCSQCSFEAQFESALQMHKQLHHEAPDVEDFLDLSAKMKAKAFTVPRNMTSPFPKKSEKPYMGPYHNFNSVVIKSTSSATKLFGKLRAKMCRSKSLFPHLENPEDVVDVTNINDIAASEGTSKALQESASRITITCEDHLKETYKCHLCEFEADRITVLDRHLLNVHKIGIESLLKLVMNKTQEGIADDQIPNIFGTRQPYYRSEEMQEEAEFVIETITPKIKILKHASMNTELRWTDIPNLKDNCRIITKEINKFMKSPNQRIESNELIEKMQSLNEIMCKFVDSSNTLKKVLTKEFHNKRDEQPVYDLGLGDQQSTREWERAHSEKIDRDRNKYGDNSRSGKSKLNTSESFYF